ncbi:hypothetical protein B0H19DRAFT_1366670 [Mycena capillaripes]|nr:hypothetical protein B0H19DRAFT_1366670 [Mycena capillaripes]
MHSRVARSADAPTTAIYIHDSPSNLNVAFTRASGKDRCGHVRVVWEIDSSTYIRVAERSNDAPRVCSMRRQALLVDCSPDEPPHVAGAAAPGIIFAHPDVTLLASLRSPAAVRAASSLPSFVPVLAPSSEGEAARRAKMTFIRRISWIFASSDAGASRIWYVQGVVWSLRRTSRLADRLSLHQSVVATNDIFAHVLFSR